MATVVSCMLAYHVSNSFMCLTRRKSLGHCFAVAYHTYAAMKHVTVCLDKMGVRSIIYETCRL